MEIPRFSFVHTATALCMLPLATGHAQTRTQTRQPYPTMANSISWITNVPYVAGGGPEQQLDLYVHKDQPPILIVHGDSDKLAPYDQATRLADALDKVNARYHFHTVVGGGHNPYFGLNTNAATGKFDAGGGGVGIFADRDVQPMIRAYLRQYLLQ
jgi:pimeloyl-ACP methyl ester carboxylesterase